MTPIPRRTVLAAALLAVGGLSPAHAQDYPAKPVRIIAPFPIGSGPDVNTREIAAELSKVLGQSVVVENRPGASNMIGMEVGAKAAPDGYTLVMGATTSLSVVPHLYAKVPYNAERDFVPISLVGLLNTALTANANVPHRTAREAIAHYDARQRSGALDESLDAIESRFSEAETSGRLVQAVRNTVSANRQKADASLQRAA